MIRHIICDSSMLDAYLKIPGKDQHASEVRARMAELENDISAHIYLPWATVIECGNHIVQFTARYKEQVRELADRLSRLVLQCLDNQSPFSRIGEWDDDHVRRMMLGFPDNAICGVGMGDTTILADCQRLCSILRLRDESQVELWTYDTALEKRFLSQRSTWMVVD